ncbi:MAG: glucose-6-phosphate isomerase, partial [Saprospiraceae bacterium]|nr:glucose-6-phosphate isomerase [Saprospiraceae bacterium]
LQHFPTYLQQASMESNGKCIGRDGSPIKYATGSVLWGGPGTNSQHSFYQLLHQGTQLIPSDFIIVANPHHNLHHHHQILVANALAQAEALMVGRTKQQVRHELEGKKQSKDEIDRLVPFKVFNGNRPSNTLLIRKLTPRALGSLIALYEHKIFVQGLIWNIYSFDQFGVELGKELAKNLQPELTGQERPDQHDESTNALLQKYKQWQE